MAVDAVGTGTAGATNRAIGAGATVFRTGVPATPGLQVGAIPTQIGAVLPRHDRRHRLLDLFSRHNYAGADDATLRRRGRRNQAVRLVFSAGVTFHAALVATDWLLGVR